MTLREGRLLNLLAWVALGSACALAAAAGLGRFGEVNASIDRYRGPLSRLEARSSEDPAALEAKIQELGQAIRRLEEGRYARDAGTGDSADFGASVRGRLRKSGLTVLRYQPGSTDPSELEFAARGSAIALGNFLLAAMNSGWEITFLSIRSASASVPVDFNLRIRHGD